MNKEHLVAVKMSDSCKLKNRFPQINFNQVSKKRAKNFHSDGKYMAIPRGKKYFAWFTFYKTYNVCVFMNSTTGELFYEKVVYSPLSLGTVLYGTLVDYKTHFVSENIFLYEGRSVEKIDFDKKLDIFIEIMRVQQNIDGSMPKKTHISIAPMWCGSVPPSFYCEAATYQVFDLCFTETAPPSPKTVLLPTPPAPKTVLLPTPPPPTAKKTVLLPTPPPAHNKKNSSTTVPTQQTRIFFVKPDIMNDIYHLYVKTNKEPPCENNLKYHSIAFIPDYKTSVFMNKIFRKIRENDNLDYIEESDDEDFEDTRYDKYVYLDKIERMTCTYNYKFKKWVPSTIGGVFTKKLSKYHTHN